MERYKGGKIYKIWNDVNDQIYVGSTCKARLSQRWHAHTSAFKQFLAGKDQYQGMKIYHLMREIGYDHFKIELIESVICNTKEELLAREGYWVREIKAELNVKIPGRSMQQWIQENRDKVKQHNKTYYLTHKEELEFQNKRSEWYNNNKADVQNYHTEWYQKNIDLIHSKNKDTILCECGQLITKCNKIRHVRTLKHQLYIQFGGLNAIDI